MERSVEEWRGRVLRCLPSVEEVLQREGPCLEGDVPRRELVEVVRHAVARAREEILQATSEELEKLPQERSQWMAKIREEVRKALRPSLRPLINATGVIVHTNLGRSLLPSRAIKAVEDVASRYSNLELDLESGKRGSRQSHLEGLLRRLTGAEAAAVVNNNAAAVLISLTALAKDREVIVSRGELVEIGGSFRMPDVMAQSGARLVEVGTTNKTYPRDYETAINERTALLLKVHTSNYRIMGFTREVALEELVDIGRKKGIPVMYDLGSGCLVELKHWFPDPEPTVQEALEKGADLITFSGDKLMGGPQAGLILGRKALVDVIRAHPLARAVRIDKMTLAALQATLELYWDPEQAIIHIPTLRMMVQSSSDLKSKAKRLAKEVKRRAPGLEVKIREDTSRVGGGALPLLRLPTWVVAVRPSGNGAHGLAKALRRADPPVVVRVAQQEVVMDVRTVQQDEIPLIGRALAACVEGDGR